MAAPAFPASSRPARVSHEPWPHQDGKGYDVTLVAFPLDCRVVIRLDEPKPVKQAEPVAEPVG